MVCGLNERCGLAFDIALGLSQVAGGHRPRKTLSYSIGGLFPDGVLIPRQVGAAGGWRAGQAQPGQQRVYAAMPTCIGIAASGNDAGGINKAAALFCRRRQHGGPMPQAKYIHRHLIAWCAAGVPPHPLPNPPIVPHNSCPHSGTAGVNRQLAVSMEDSPCH